jgi:rod shape-determining protein MreC
MPLGTLDRTPPPFFRQGPSALTRLAFFSALAVFLMVSDTRFDFIGPIRATLATAMLPMQHSLSVPVQLWGDSSRYLQGLQSALQNERAAKAALVRQADRAAAAEQLAAENQRLRALLELRPALSVRALAAEVMYEAADPYSRKVFIDRGRTHEVALGSPVINEVGVLGQVTRLYPLTAEVTLLTDRDAAIPVLNTRTQQRSAAFGGAGGGANPTMELRFMAGNADVQPGDALVTSGIDGIYPPGDRKSVV